MTEYEDKVVALDDEGITVKQYGARGGGRRIRYADIRAAKMLQLGFGTGLFRLVGFSPGRPRHYFHWDPDRRSKRHGISLDVGGVIRPVITPRDPRQVLEIISARLRGR